MTDLLPHIWSLPEPQTVKITDSLGLIVLKTHLDVGELDGIFLRGVDSGSEVEDFMTIYHCIGCGLPSSYLGYRTRQYHFIVALAAACLHCM